MLEKKKMIFVFVAGAVTALVLFLGVKTSLQAQEPTGANDNSEKLTQIIQTQAAILQEIAVVKEQLNAIQLHTNKL